MIVDARITAIKAGLPLETDQLEAHYLAEGNVVQTVQALIASKANIELVGIGPVPLICNSRHDQIGLGGSRTSINLRSLIV